MAEISPVFSIQLKETCKLTGARWAVWLKRTEKTWECVLPGYLSKARLATIKNLIQQTEEASWLAGTLSSGRTRSRQAGLFSKNLGCQRLFAFPNKMNRSILLVGAGDLDKVGLRFFQTLALDAPVFKIESKKRTDLNGILTILDNLKNDDSVSLAQDVLVRLHRILADIEVSLFLLSGDGKRLRILKGEHDSLEETLQTTLDGTVAGYVIKTGKIVRVDEQHEPQMDFYQDTDLPSVLAVPFIYQGRRFGVIRLDSEQRNAFSLEDEWLLQVFANYLAILFENIRLNREERGRTLNLRLIHQLVQQVVGLKDVQEIAQMTAELIADYFQYEFSVVLVSEKDGDVLVGAGVGGTSAHLLTPGFRYPSNQGLTGHVFRSGKSFFSNDVSQEPEYFSLSGWVAGSEMCVPLREGPRVFGLINVERAKKDAFTDQELQLLESLAGILSSVMMNAQRYQELARLYGELQESIKAHQSTELQLVRSARMAAVGELAAGVAHELNNPLTTIAGFVELVLEEIPPGSQEYEDLNLVLKETRRASGVVRQLLDFSRQTEKSLLQIDINELSKEVLALVQHLIKTSGVQIKLELCEDLPVIQADPNQLKQVLLNLIQNALQAMPYGGLLLIRTRQHSTHGQNGVTIMIQDSGVGIPPENLGRIFEPFFTTRPGGVGTGLGLPVSYGIVTNHRGTIEVESQVGSGSCFTIWLPCDKDRAYA